MKKTIIFIIALLILLTVVGYAAEENEITDITELESDAKQDSSIINEGSATEIKGNNAKEEKENTPFDIKEYLTEKILPIVAGVATSLVALGGTIYKIKSSLATLNSSNDSLSEVKKTVSSTLDNVKEELAKGICQVQTKIKDIPELKEGYEELKSSYNELIKQNKALLEALKLGFESLPEAVRSGNARKIAIITEEVADEK